MAMVCRDDLCEKAQVSLIVHGSERVREALATRSVLSKRVQVALAVQGGSATMRVLAGRGDLCDHARRLLF